MTDDLVQFLRARLDETAAKARAHRQASADWYYDDSAKEIRDRVNSGTVAFVPAHADAEHIARHDPARVLAEVDAKRQIVARYERAMDNRRAHPADLASAGAFLALHGAVKLLGLPYADHPNYRPEWAPDPA
jgi:hypothetical protein